MRERMGDFLRALEAEAKLQNVDDIDLPRTPDVRPVTALMKECRAMLRKIAENKRQVEVLSREVITFTGGYIIEGTGDVGTNETLEELESVELEVLTFCTQCDHRLLTLARRHGEGEDHRSKHIKALLNVVGIHSENLACSIQAKQRARRRIRERAVARRKAGGFAQVTLNDQHLRELRGVPERGVEEKGEGEDKASSLVLENQQLMKRLETQSTDLMEMSESKLVDMSAMMSTFNQKVFEQEETVEGIMATEETARQYTADGVKEIQTAADRSKGQQIW
eukprot:CAMPEP_0167781012 /NCGR_PEP_ID=MMETSP0111_2-20121227/5687_1 /TAXON_ID=91324 /ORGANISM="Lotharella globosa, Strain CCCM811" /LENGTH=279 /DNA_ID=CAMNT_0007671609 /DNA_START=18 /DNA_END=854 /DNA_ORIENTATION=-